MSLKIPAGQEAALARLFSMSENDYSALRIAIEDVKPSISIDDLASRVASKAMLDASETSEIVWLLFGAYCAFERTEETSLDEFVDELCDAAKTSDDKNLAETEDWELAKKRLREILSLHRTLGLSAKAFDIIRETERLYCRARILTDIRPVFVADDPSAAEASVIVHSLRVAFHVGPTKNVENFFVSLETDDLEKLRQVINRALLKDKALRAIAVTAGIPSLSYETTED